MYLVGYTTDSGTYDEPIDTENRDEAIAAYSYGYGYFLGNDWWTEYLDCKSMYEAFTALEKLKQTKIKQNQTKQPTQKE